MFQAPFFFQQAIGGGAPLTAPVMSNRLAIVKTDTNIWGSNTTGTMNVAYTSSAGNVVLFGCARSTAATTRIIGSDWNGAVMSQLAAAKTDGTLNLTCSAGFKEAGAVGAGTLHILEMPAVTSNRFRHMVGWAFDLDHVRGGIGGANANAIAVEQGFVEVSITVAEVGSLLVAAGWNQNSGARPFTWTAGWSKLDEQQIGEGDQPCGSIASRTSTATGPQVVRMTGDSLSGTWAIAVAEFLKG